MVLMKGMKLVKDDAFLTVQEVSQQLRVSELTVTRLVRRGELLGVRVGRQIRIAQSSLDDYIRRNTEGKERQ
jgi:excisionase family DNA binding protein